MNKFKVAHLISTLFNPYIHPLHVFAYLGLTGLIKPWEAILGIVLYTIVPTVAHLIVVNFTGEPHNIPYREHRVPILIAAFLGYIISHVLCVSSIARLVALVYIAGSIAMLVLLILARLSAHVMAFIPPITIYAYVSAIPLAICFTILMLVTAWSRARLDAHNALEISLALLAGFSASTTVLLIH